VIIMAVVVFEMGFAPTGKSTYLMHVCACMCVLPGAHEHWTCPGSLTVFVGHAVGLDPPVQNCSEKKRQFCARSHTYTYVRTGTHTHTHTYYIHICTHTHTHSHACTHTHKHMYI
jgi:hypothetical protein